MKNATTNLMKETRWLGLVASVMLPLFNGCAQPAPAPAPTSPAPGQAVSAVPASISPEVAEVIRLAGSGVGEDVILAYIENSASGFNLSADQILYLRDLGISSQVITAMLNRDTALRSQSQPSSPPTTQPPPGPEPTVPVEAPLTPLPVEVSSPPVQVNYFYSDLAPYGTWVDLAGIGWCWQPRAVVINRGWSPYCDGGHWIYTDAGWYWQSDYSWGWAPFHYGRWQMHPRCGWVWMPDTVWGPAWVVWRHSGDYCGWAPLPPFAVFDVGFGWRFNGVHVGVNFDFGLPANHFTFIGIHDFNERDLRHRRLEHTQVTRIYNNTKIINNYTVNNTTIVNRGIPVERVTSAARTPVHRATVRELPAGSSRAVATAPGAERGQAVVYRPHLTAPARTAPVTIQKIDERHPVIQHSPSVPVASQPRPGVEGRSTAPTTGPRRGQPETPRTPPRQNVERPGSYAPNQPSPRASESKPRTEPAPRTPQAAPQPAPRPSESAPRASQPAARNYQSTPNAAAVPAPTRPSQENRQPERAAPSYRTETVTPSSPAQARGRYSEAQPDSRGGNPHVYSPKGSEQSAGSRSAVPSAPRQSSPSSQPGSSGGSQNKKGGS